jgi:L-ribulose-5-phosphate 3-epimerase
MHRRKFITSSIVGVAAIPSIVFSGNETNRDKIIELPKSEMTTGVISWIKDPDKDIRQIRDFGFSFFQAGVENYTPEMADGIFQACLKYEVSPLALICMGPGPYLYNPVDGPSTIGLVPREYRKERTQHLKDGIDFCKGSGFPAVFAHFGFIPENPKDVLYLEFIDIMKEIGAYALNRGINILFETGQETPVTLLRSIEAIGTGNLFVNLDVGNLLLYGKANPLDGLQVLGKYVRSLHAKDADYPTNPNELGKEYPIPEGKVDFPAIISKLKRNNFKGCIVIENELSTNSKEYLTKTRKYLENLIQNS